MELRRHLSVVRHAQPQAAPSPDVRARLLEQALTLDERLALVHSPMAMELGEAFKKPQGAIGSAGYVAGVARLGVPALNQSDASRGVCRQPERARGVYDQALRLECL